MSIILKDLFEEFQLSYEDLPPLILNIELENEKVNHFQKGYKQNNVFYFKGEYSPEWMGKDSLLGVDISIDLTRFTNKLINASIEFGNGEEPSIEINNDIFERFISEEVVSFTQTVENNFTYHATYSILGSMIKES